MAFTSDDFFGSTLAPVWTTEDPNANCTFSVSSGQLHIGMSAGQAHDYYNGVHTAPRITQVVTDSNFRVTAKFDQLLDVALRDAGLIFFGSSDNNVTRCDIYYDGVSQNIFAAHSTADTFTNEVNNTISFLQPFYIRVTKVGNVWTEEYSGDGVSWTTAGTWTFAMTLSKAGVYGGNADPGGGAPAHALLCDFFHVEVASQPVVRSQAVSRSFNW